MPGLKTQNNLGATSSLSITGNTFSGNTGVAIWFFCNSGKCTTGSTVSGNRLSGNALIGNLCGRQVQVDNLASNNVIHC